VGCSDFYLRFVAMYAPVQSDYLSAGADVKRARPGPTSLVWEHSRTSVDVGREEHLLGSAAVSHLIREFVFPLSERPCY